MIADRDMDADVFVVSELTIEVHQAPTGRLIRFNGTTEWALDSVEQEATVWLPREGQLRAALGPRFRRLEPVGDGFAVVIDASRGRGAARRRGRRAGLRPGAARRPAG